MSRQLALPFLHREFFGEESFLRAPSNGNALAFLADGRDREWPGGRLALWGPPGCGKTHLLHLWLGRLRRAGRDAALLDGAAVRGLEPDAPLPDAGGGLAIDDADASFADGEALLHLLNRLGEAGVAAVLASRDAPARCPVDPPDLASRLRATLAVGIGDPEDALLDALFARLLAERQLAVPPEVARFLRDRLPREPAALRDAARRLDEASLRAGRRVTTALAASLLSGERPPF